MAPAIIAVLKSPQVGAMVSAKSDDHIFTINFPMQVCRAGFVVVKKIPAYDLKSRPSLTCMEYRLKLFYIPGLGGPAFDNRKIMTLWQTQRRCTRKYADDLSIVCSDFTGI